jgi:hypothetical protein
MFVSALFGWLLHASQPRPPLPVISTPDTRAPVPVVTIERATSNLLEGQFLADEVRLIGPTGLPLILRGSGSFVLPLR